MAGSPPHGRGILCSSNSRNSDIGITPACAGNTIRPKTLQFDSWDHPRMRGEYEYDPQDSMRSAGSPPHARGILYLHSEAFEYCGITPACAGNTFFLD